MDNALNRKQNGTAKSAGKNKDKGVTPKHDHQRSGGQGSRSDSDQFEVIDQPTGSPVVTPSSNLISIQRFGAVVQLIESFDSDMGAIEERHSREMKLAEEVEKLKVALQALVQSKTDEVTNLKLENTELHTEMDGYRRNEQQLEDQKMEAEACQASAKMNHEFEVEKMKHEHKSALSKEKLKYQNRTKVHNAEFQTYKETTVLKSTRDKEITRLEDTMNGLTKQVEQLLQQLAAVKFEQEEEKDQHRCQIKVLRAEAQGLKEKISVAESDCVIQMEPLDSFAKSFQAISDHIQAVAQNHFNTLPEELLEGPEAALDTLKSSSAVFKYMPASQSDISKLLRVSGVASIISTILCRRIWTFFSNEILDGYSGAKDMLFQVSNNILAANRRRHSVWKLATCQSLTALAASLSAPSAAATSAVNEMLATLRVLLKESDVKNLEADLTTIVQAAQQLWQKIELDSCRLAFERDPPKECSDGWQAQLESTIDWIPQTDGAMVETGPRDEERETVASLCLFPRIIAVNLLDESAVLHSGLALFADSALYDEGLLEQMATKKVLREALKETRRQMSVKHTARKASLNNGPVLKLATVT